MDILAISSLGAIMNTAPMDICEQIFVWTYVFILPGWILKSRTARWDGKCMFNIIRNCLIVSKMIV